MNCSKMTFAEIEAFMNSPKVHPRDMDAQGRLDWFIENVVQVGSTRVLKLDGMVWRSGPGERLSMFDEFCTWLDKKGCAKPTFSRPTVT